MPRAAASTMARALHREFVRRRRASDGRFLRDYLGSPVPVLGLRTAEFRLVLREFVRTHRDLSVRELEGVARELWRGPWYEDRALAFELLSRYPRRLGGWSWRLAARWVDSATGWALSDSLASGLVSLQLTQTPSRFPEVLRWTRSTNFWRRRASLYAMNRFVRQGELDRPFRVIDRLRADPERWVQRAVGTWLRECWKQDRDRTERYLLRNAPRLPPVVITVATERAPPAFRRRLRGLADRTEPRRRAPRSFAK